MSRHHFSHYLIGTCKQQQYFIPLISLLMFIVSYQNVSAQQGIAQDTYAIFEQSCLVCHGPDGAYKESLLIEHNALIEKGSVVPGNPDASELYNRLITTDAVKRMPLGGPPLPNPQIETVKNWILAGAPDWAVRPPTDRPFISPSESLNTIEAHLMSLASFDRTFARYFTMTHLYNAGETPGVLQEYRKALYKLVNSLSWGVTVTNPQPIDPQETIFYVDLRHYEWDRNDAWPKIETEYPYHIGFDAPEQAALKEQLRRLQTEMKVDIPSIHVDWFIATASLPPLYHELLSLPLTDRELETRLEVDVLQNLLSAPGVRVWRAGTNNSGVSANNRVLERHTSRYGAYWKSYDFAGSVGTQNIFNHPLGFTPDGGEVIFNLPNGLQAYYVTNASGFRLDEAPINIVSNPAASDPTVRNGLSCFGCHTKGMNTFEDQVRPVIESNATPAYDKEQALRLYVEQSEMDALVQGDMDRYRGALEATGGKVDDIEPIQRFHEAFHGPVDAVYAAASVGLETEAFLEKIRENVGLQNVGLLVLGGENGSMKRDAWTSNFRDMLFALDFPKLVDKPPVITEPDRLPGTVVHIPDTNLRAAIAAELGKDPNAPITVEEMETLQRLEAEGKGIRDLIGLQFATNLDGLSIRDNQVTDISPVAGLIKLRDLNFHNNPVSDLSPVRGLINLTHLAFPRTLVSDLSPLAGLINMEELWFNAGARISDLSPLAGLINLRIIHAGGHSISDLSPLSGLTKLEHVYLPGTGLISDFTPLLGLTGLKDLYLDGGNISDISLLARFTELERLGLDHNDISDISPLAGLTNLKWLRIDNNDISDVSPLVGLTNLAWLSIGGNNISDLSFLVGLTHLEELYFDDSNISDISPIAGLTGLERLGLNQNDISDISPIAGLTNLKWLNLSVNNISDVSPILNLTNLTWLSVERNNISDLSPLMGLREKIKLFWAGNPGLPEGGPKIEGPWLWVLLPGLELEPDGVDLLSAASGGTVTELAVATNGARVGNPVGDAVWISHRLPSEPQNNIGEMLGHDPPDGSIYGTVSIYSPREQETTLHIGADNEVKVWLNGVVVYQNFQIFGSGDYTDFAPVTLRAGKNILLVAVGIGGRIHNGKFGFKPGTEYAVATGVGYAFSQTPIHPGDTFTLDIYAEDVTDLAGWQFDIVFDPAALEAIDVTEGNFLKTDGGNTFFQSGTIDNATGKITGLSAAKLSVSGVSGTGTLVQVRFKAKLGGNTQLTLRKFQFGSVTGDNIPAGPHEITIVVEGQLTAGDVNRDGIVTILDLILAAQQLGQKVPAGSPVDVNGDGVVSVLDLLRIAQGMAESPAAPPIGTNSVDAATIEAWIAQARLEEDGSLAFKQGIENLEILLASLIPEKTALLPNYPNPFNPETWIPYQLAEPAEVTLTIYDMNGRVVRRLAIGHQAAGIYQSRSRAVYWDGRNQLGEPLASGLYFYTLTVHPVTKGETGADDFTATRRMLILK